MPPKYGELDLLAKNILVKDGGERRVRDTTWAGRPQPTAHADGSTKGLRTIFQERGINTSTLKAKNMRMVLFNHDAFFNEKRRWSTMLKVVAFFATSYQSSTASSTLSSVCGVSQSAIAERTLTSLCQNFTQ